MNKISHSLAQHLEHWLGINIGITQHETMMRGMQRVAYELGWGNDPHIWAARLGNNPGPETLRVLAKHITIGETYFFREEPSVDFIRQVIVPEVQKHISQTNLPYIVWTAACSTGEEPYSVAMLLLEAIPSLSEKNLQILATDVNPEALSKARTGIYREWSFRTTPPAIKSKYFTRESSHWVISERVRKFVRFRLHNLINDPYPYSVNTGQCNLIFCRNVFIYFDFATIRGIADRFFECLVPGGWLVTSQVELNDELFGQYARIAHSNGFFYRKPLTGSTRKNNPGNSQDQFGKARAQIPNSSPKRNLSEKDSGSFSKKSTIKNFPSKDQSTPKQNTISRQGADKPATLRSLTSAGPENEHAKPSLLASHVSTQFNSALQFIEQQQPAMALECLQKVLYLSPEHLEARFQLANLLNNMQLHAESVAQYKLIARQLENMPPETPVFGGLSAQALLALCNLAINRHE